MEKIKDIHGVFILKHNIAKSKFEKEIVPSLETHLNELDKLIKKSGNPEWYSIKCHSENIIKWIKSISDDTLYI
jgi:hypothetical protein